MRNNPTNVSFPLITSEDKHSAGSRQSSSISAIRSIFFNPEITFKSFQTKPHFITAGLMLIILATAFQIALQERIGVERLLYDQLNAIGHPVSPSKDQVEQFVVEQNSLSARITRYLPTPIGLSFVFVVGSFFLWVGVSVFGKSITYLQALSVWIFSSFAPGFVFWASNFVMIFLKPIEELSFYKHRKGVIAGSPSIFLDLEGSPVLATIVGTFDVFYVWGLILAVIGVKVLGGLSRKSASILIISMAVLGLIGRVVLARVTHLPQ